MALEGAQAAKCMPDWDSGATIAQCMVVAAPWSMDFMQQPHMMYEELDIAS